MYVFARAAMSVLRANLISLAHSQPTRCPSPSLSPGYKTGAHRQPWRRLHAPVICGVRPVITRVQPSRLGRPRVANKEFISPTHHVFLSICLSVRFSVFFPLTSECA